MRYVAAALLGLMFSYVGLAEAQAATSVPLGGNAYITVAPKNAAETINDTGLHNWTSSQTVVSTYFYAGQAGTLDLSLAGSLAGASHSQVKVSLGGQTRTADLYGTGTSPFPVGSFYVDAPGYVKVDLQGVSTDGKYFGDISDLLIDGAASTGAVFANDPANFYWSRRGPSVHLGFGVPANTEYFYSEITVPQGQDPVGTYYMANGFDVGYAGIQVNSPKERWVLFSVWDSPTGSTTLVRKGSQVITNGFGGEGTGGQSHLVFPWVAGKTYHFLTRAQPDGSGNTLYSFWFGVPVDKKNAKSGVEWKFLATWKYVGRASYLTSTYSFLEGFNPATGYLGRRASYGNQWAIGADGTWTEITRARFTVDATGRNQQRLDFAGGATGNAFFLRNDGFFSDTVAPDQYFDRSANLIHPEVDFSQLP